MSLKHLQVQYISGAHRRLRRMGIYVHIPFCAKKCAYCDFYSTTDTSAMDDYIKALAVDFRRSRADLSGASVETVYFGGGTPGMLGPKRLAWLLKKLRQNFAFTADAEITLESNPATLSFEDYQKLRRAGFNRISFGVQSLNDSELKRLGRIHNSREAAQAVRDARRAGFENISIDIMFGLPGQTVDSLMTTLSDARELAPDHISFYGLKIEEGTPFHDIKDSLDLPDEDEYAKLYLSGAQKLCDMGYIQYEISNFAKDGFACRHNLKYWKLNEYVGFGPAAHSFINATRYGLTRDLAGYINAVRSGALPERSEEELIEPEAQIREYIMMSLRLADGINRMVFEARFGQSFDKVEEFFSRISKGGLAERTEYGWRLTMKGFLISNTIIIKLLEYIGK